MPPPHKAAGQKNKETRKIEFPSLKTEIQSPRNYQLSFHQKIITTLSKVYNGAIVSDDY